MTDINPGEFIADPEKSALLVVDMQNDFVLPEAEISTPRGMEIIPKIAALADACRDNGLPVIYTQEMHRPQLEDFGIEGFFEPPHCLEGTPGAEIVAGLQPKHSDHVIVSKRRYDAFIGTELDILLRCLKIENIMMVGVCTDICVIATVHHARNLDYRCFVIEDAVDGTTAERHDAALLCMRHVFALTGTSAEAGNLFGLKLPVAAE